MGQDARRNSHGGSASRDVTVNDCVGTDSGTCPNVNVRQQHRTGANTCSRSNVYSTRQSDVVEDFDVVRDDDSFVNNETFGTVFKPHTVPDHDTGGNVRSKQHLDHNEIKSSVYHV